MPTICAAVRTSTSVVEIRHLDIEGLIELRPPRFDDQRGFFSEVWRNVWQAQIGRSVEFVQDNHSYSRCRGVLRGMHFQVAPAGQDKLVRVARGSIFDVAIDVRSQSPSFGKWAGTIISARDWNQLFVPEGFAHGFVTLEDDTEVLYKASSPYAPELERTVRFDDPAIGVEWPIDADQLIVSEKDRAAPLLAELEMGF